MSTKKARAGAEIDAYCTKCKLDLMHRIIAMVGDAVKKVECTTCGSHHLYRRPKTEPEVADHNSSVGSSAAKPPRSSKPPKTAKERMTAAARAERERVDEWQRAIAGKPTGAFKPYKMSTFFAMGDLVRHSKFGDGLVARVIDQRKIEVFFEEGAKIMAHGQA